MNIDPRHDSEVKIKPPAPITPNVIEPASFEESCDFEPAPAVQGEPVYLYRRLGLDDFVTCDFTRYTELSGKPHLFETKILYAALQTAEQKSTPDVELKPDDLIIQLWSSKARSQWDYTLERGVKITHVPSGIAVTCDTERSMHANKNKALGELQSQLAVNPAPDVAGLVEAAQRVLDGLNARIDSAAMHGGTTPVFDGIANLHDALAAHRRGGVQQWQPIGTCPRHVDVLFYREDAGVFQGKFTNADSFMTDKERDEWVGTEEEMFDLDAWSYEPEGVYRMDGDLAPTHWMPLPAPPATQGASHDNQ